MNVEFDLAKGKKHSPVAAACLDHMKKEKIGIVQLKFDWNEKYLILW